MRKIITGIAVLCVALGTAGSALAYGHNNGGSQKSVQLSTVTQIGTALSSGHGWNSGAVVVNDNGTAQGSTQVATGSGSQSSLQGSGVTQGGFAAGSNAGVSNGNTTLQGNTQLLFGSAYGH